MTTTKALLRVARGWPAIDYDTGSTEAGCTVRGTHWSTDRYIVDFADDFKANGWQQFDTDQDAHYFGVWLNPRERVTLTYCEGDWSLVECPTDEHYRAEVARVIEFYEPGRVARVIDADTGQAVDVCQDRAEFLKGDAAQVIGIGDVIREALSDG